MAIFGSLYYAEEYFIIMPGGEVFISEKMPPEMRERFLIDVEKERKRCEESHRKGIYSSKDYF